MRKDCSDIDKDLKSIKEIFVSMRSNWEEFEEAGADCEDIDSFVREMEKKKWDEFVYYLVHFGILTQYEMCTYLIKRNMKREWVIVLACMRLML